MEALLNRIADGLEDIKDQLVPVVVEESALSQQRIESELGRTTNQLRLYVSSYIVVTIPGLLK